MYSKQLEELIDAVLADGVITEKERAVLHRKAEKEGVDLDEIDIMIDGRLVALKKEAASQTPSAEVVVPPVPEPKKNTKQKIGEVVYCPNCNAVVPPGKAKCEECGYEFRNVGVVNSVQKFSDTLNDIESRFQNREDFTLEDMDLRRNSIITAVSNFPVPNSKEDLLEFIIFTESKLKHLPAGSLVDYAIRKAYKAKYFECVDKARIYFNADPQFQPIFAGYEENKKRKLKDISPMVRIGFIFGSTFALILLILVLAAIFG